MDNKYNKSSSSSEFAKYWGIKTIFTGGGALLGWGAAAIVTSLVPWLAPFSIPAIIGGAFYGLSKSKYAASLEQVPKNEVCVVTKNGQADRIVSEGHFCRTNIQLPFIKSVDNVQKRVKTIPVIHDEPVNSDYITKDGAQCFVNYVYEYEVRDVEKFTNAVSDTEKNIEARIEVAVKKFISSKTFQELSEMDADDLNNQNKMNSHDSAEKILKSINGELDNRYGFVFTRLSFQSIRGSDELTKNLENIATQSIIRQKVGKGLTESDVSRIAMQNIADGDGKNLIGFPGLLGATEPTDSNQSSNDNKKLKEELEKTKELLEEQQKLIKELEKKLNSSKSQELENKPVKVTLHRRSVDNKKPMPNKPKQNINNDLDRRRKTR